MTTSDTPSFITRPLPRNPRSAVVKGDWHTKARNRADVTPHQMNILGVLYSTVYMGKTQEAKTAQHQAFAVAGISVKADDLTPLLEKGWVTKQAASGLRWRLTAAGSRGYDKLYYAEEDGLWPPEGPVPPTPDQILEARRLGSAHVGEAGGRNGRRSVADLEALRHQEVLRAIDETNARLDNLSKVISLAMQRLEHNERRYLDSLVTDDESEHDSATESVRQYAARVFADSHRGEEEE